MLSQCLFLSVTFSLKSFHVLNLGILKLGGYDVLDKHIPHSLDVGDHLSNGRSICTQIYHMTIRDVDDAKESTLLLTFWWYYSMLVILMASQKTIFRTKWFCF